MKYKIKTIYDNLKPEFKAELNINARKYSSAKRLKYTLMSKVSWQELTLGENQAEAHFKWEPKSGCFIPHEPISIGDDPMPWE
jgi:hypothetical protein